MKAGTKAIHVGHGSEGTAPLVTPITLASTFTWENLHQEPEYVYTRYTNPSRTELEKILASLENGRFCTCYASGMAAMTAAFSALQAGDHVLIASDIYGGTSFFAAQEFERSGIQWSEFDAICLESVEEVARPNTKMIVFETPTNPVLRLADISAIAKLAKSKGWISVLDNTFASPILQNPLEYGIDVVMHSLTKYINGHSDLIGGALITNSEALGERFFKYAKTAGANLGPFEAYLTVRGVRTLNVRMREHCKNAMGLAEYFKGAKRVRKVYYPGLKEHPGHELAARQMKGGFGGMLAIELDATAEETSRIAKSLKIFSVAASFGGVESIISYPMQMSHKMVSDAEKLAKGVTPSLLRISAGIEDLEDLIADWEQALKA
ncbi:MAG: aminotransferase class I/II-fold pyridoxal phosphate-dependent enzyme [Armatimonadetes bacterium]|nr:aminotransferase class I/II-fold pyridoxal phosphate-dependent enzyme [Armatimonadota bacterium]